MTYNQLAEIKIQEPIGEPFELHNNKANDAVLEHTLAVVANRLLQGYSLRDIAEELGVSKPRAAELTRQVAQHWRNSAMVDIDEARGIELAKLDKLEHEYWLAWERSKMPRTMTTQRTAPMPAGSSDMRVTAGMRTEERDGDPRFLDGVFKCIERRIKIYGLDQPDKIAMAGVFDVNNDNELTKRLARYEAILAGTPLELAATGADRYRVAEPVDSERSASEAGNVPDAD